MGCMCQMLFEVIDGHEEAYAAHVLEDLRTVVGTVDGVDDWKPKDGTHCRYVPASLLVVDCVLLVQHARLRQKCFTLVTWAQNTHRTPRDNALLIWPKKLVCVLLFHIIVVCK